MNLIEKVIFPLKDEAIQKALQHADVVIKKVRKELEEAGNDLQLTAPMPKSFNESRQTYQIKMSRYKLFNSLCKTRAPSRKYGAPRIADVDDEKVNRFKKEVSENAGVQYDAFVAKLNKKIGEVSEATLTGNHVWDYSFLNVTTKDGEKQTWKTHQIVNVSKLGKLFNQWPTRKVKS